jgi:hypothetical protein
MSNTLKIEDYKHIESELMRIKSEMDVLFDLAWSNEAFRLGRDISAIQSNLQELIYMCHPQPEWTGGDSSDPKNTKINFPHIHKLD